MRSGSSAHGHSDRPSTGPSYPAWAGATWSGRSCSRLRARSHQSLRAPWRLRSGGSGVRHRSYSTRAWSQSRRRWPSLRRARGRVVWRAAITVVVTDSRPGRTDIEPGTPLLEHAGEGSRLAASLFRGLGWPCRRSRRDNWAEDLRVTRYPAFSAPSLRTLGGPWRGGWRVKAAGTRRWGTSR